MEKIINDFLETGHEPSYNVKPTNSAEIWLQAQGGFDAYSARWWLVPHWFKGASAKDWKATTFNARIEEAAAKPSFRDAWKRGRCLVPARGYFEWKAEAGEKTKQPYFVEALSNRPYLTFAGLWSEWQGQKTFTLMTRAAVAEMAWLHPRTPVILSEEEQAAWLSGSEDLEIGRDARLRYYPVKKFGLADNGPELIEPYFE